MYKIFCVSAYLACVGRGQQLKASVRQKSSDGKPLNSFLCSESSADAAGHGGLARGVLARLLFSFRTSAAFNPVGAAVRAPARSALHKIHCCEVPPPPSSPTPPADPDSVKVPPAPASTQERTFSDNWSGAGKYADEDKLPLSFWLLGPNPRRAILPIFIIWGVIAPATNLWGSGSFLASLSPEFAREQGIDRFYPVGTRPLFPWDKGYLDYSTGFKKYIDDAGGRFEFRYPAMYVQDLTVYKKNMERAFNERSMDPQQVLPQNQGARRVYGPTVAFGPQGGAGEENLSVITSPAQPGFTLRKFGPPTPAAEYIIQSSIARPGFREVTLLNACERNSAKSGKLLYQFEYRVDYVDRPGRQPTYTICVAGVSGDTLYTFASRIPSAVWKESSDVVREVANSFELS